MKKLFLKSLALVMMLTMSVSMWAVDWSGISFLGDGAGGGKYSNKYKVEMVAEIFEIVNIQHPGFATADGIYLSFIPSMGACTSCSVDADLQGGGAVLHLSAFTAKETEVTMHLANGDAVFHVYYADGVDAPAAPESEYCFYEGDETKSGDKYVTMSWTTADNGDVVITLVPGTGATTAEYRNGGFEGGIDAFVVSTDNFATTTPASNYFTFEKVYSGNEARLVKIADLPADAKIKHVGAGHALAWKLDGGDAWGFPDFVFTYGAVCVASKTVTGVTLDKTTASVPANKTLTLKATVAPADAADKSVTWLSSKPEVATVADGVVTPVAEGTTTITVKTNDGDHTASCEVTVTAALAFAPTEAAPVPTVEAAKVMSIYSDAYTPCVDMSNINILNQGWWDNPSMTQEEIEGNHMLHYYGRMTGMIGWEHAHVNIGTMNKVHVDIWAQVDGTLTMGPTSANPTVVAQRVLTLVGQQWNSFDLDLTTDFNKTLDLSDMFQNQFTEYSAQENLFVDNYFYYTTLDIDVEKPVMTSASLESASFTSAVLNVAATDNRGVTKYIVKNGSDELGKYTAADGKITVTGLTDGTAYTLSIYAQDAAENVSDNKVDVELTTLAMPEAPAAPDVAAKDYRAVYAPSLTNMLAHDFVLQNWGSAAGTKMADKGYIFYHTTNNATVVWGENNAGGNAIVAADAYKGDKGGLDASAMEYMHVDIWADKAGCNSMVVVIDDRAYNAAQTLNAGWNSIDLAMSNFAWTANPADYNQDNVAWIKFVGLNNTNDVAITNVYFWKSTSTTKTVTATTNIAEAGTAVVKQEGVEVTEAENGSEVTFHAEANDGYVFLGWYAGAELKSTDADYVVTVDGNTSLQARFRALNNIYCHTELTSTVGDKVIYLTMKRTAENQYQVVIDSEEEMNGFSNAYIGKINGNNEIRLNDATGGKQNVTISDNKHRLTVDVTSTTPIRWNSPVYINMPGEFTFTTPNQQTIEYDVTCAPVAVESVTLSETSATVDVEGTVTLAASASPIYADNQTVTWTSNDETVATVVNGVVTGHAEGNATITATIGGKSATCAVSVALDATVPHVAAPAVDATGKVIRAIYTDDVELAITNAEFGLNVYGNVPYEKKAIEGNNFLLYTATETQQVISWGSGNGWDGALLGKVTDPDDAGAKGLYAADMKYLHIDIWSSEAASAFHIQNDNAIIAIIDLDGSGWQSFDIDMTGKENNLKNISIMKFANTPRNTKVALDNLYFWKLEDVHATGVSLNKTETSIVEGTQETLVATIAPANATLTACTWESNNTTVATVADGVVTAVAPGEATITVTTVDGGHTATCVVTVTADMSRPQTAAPAVATDGVEIRAIYTDAVTLAIAHDFGFNPWGGAPVSKEVVAANNYLLIDAATQNNMTIGLNNDGATAIIAKEGMSDPENTDNKGLYVAGMKYCHIDIWSKVAKTGVKVLINDHALTSINLTDEGWQSFDIELVDADMAAAANVRWMKVIDMPTGTKLAIDNLYFWKSTGTAAVTGVELNMATLTLEDGQSATLVANVLPAAAANKNVTWETSDDQVATVDAEGKVTAVGVGNATITVKTVDGELTAECAVTVEAIQAKTWWGTASDANMSIVYSVTRNADKTLTYSVELDGTYGAERQINDGDWHNLTNNDGVWSWTSTQTYNTGENVHAFWYFPARFDFDYTVGSENERPTVEVTDVTISQAAATLLPGETVQLTASVVPSNATNKTITWATDNAEAATVVDGLVTAVAAGTAHITATNGSFSAICTVTVMEALTPKTTYGSHYFKFYEGDWAAFNYFITRNADRTVTLTAIFDRDVTGKIGVNDFQLHIGDTYPKMSYDAATKTATYTFDSKYNDGDALNFAFRFVIANGLVEKGINYTVGSESAPVSTVVAINELVADNYDVAEPVDVVLGRSFTSGSLYTLCLPFSMDEELVSENFGSAKIWKLTDSDLRGSLLHIDFTLVNVIEAGVPYLFEPAKDFEAGSLIENVTIVSTPQNINAGYIQMHGMFAPATMGGEGDDSYFLNNADNCLYRLGTARTVKGLRAYFTLGASLPQGVQARVRFQESVTSDINTIDAEAQAVKVLVNGQIYILRGESMYNMQGQLVK